MSKFDIPPQFECQTKFLMSKIDIRPQFDCQIKFLMSKIDILFDGQK